MNDEPMTDAELAKWRNVAANAQAKAPSPWDRETQVVRGEAIAFNELQDANGKVWADSFNSDQASICEDYDEDGSHLYDCGTLEVFEHLSTFDPPTVLRLLAALAASEARYAAALADGEQAALRAEAAETDTANWTTFIQQYTAWANRTFPSGTALSASIHLRREAEELSESGAAEEVADCFMLTLFIAHKLGIDLLAEARRKFAVNLTRQWAPPDAEGVAEHVDDALLAERASR